MPAWLVRWPPDSGIPVRPPMTMVTEDNDGSNPCLRGGIKWLVLTSDPPIPTYILFAPSESRGLSVLEAWNRNVMGQLSWTELKENEEGQCQST